MVNLKWFSGGSDRSEKAIVLIEHLIREIKKDDDKENLTKVLLQYLTELNKKEASVPFILSRMNLDISSALKKDASILDDNQEKILKELSSISNIRYGY